MTAALGREPQHRTRDDTTVRVGIGLVTAEVPPGSGRTVAGEYADTLRIAERAEHLGFDSLWTSEHHGVTDGYLPAQLILLAAVAAVTEHIELGTGVLVAPVHDPLRVAEDALVLDNLSRGRLRLGLGLGWRPEEYRMFSVPQASRVEHLVDTVHVLRKAFGGTRFSHHGTVYHFDDVLVTPAPYRAGGPPLLLGGSVPNAVRRAGTLADGFIRSRRDGREGVATDVRTALDAYAAAGRDRDAFELVLLQNLGLLDIADPIRTERIRAGLAYQLGMYAALHDDDDTPGRGFAAREVTAATLDAAALWGTPAQIAADLVAQVVAAHPIRRCELVLRVTYPGMDLVDALQLMDLLALEVRPRVDATLAERAATDV